MIKAIVLLLALSVPAIAAERADCSAIAKEAAVGAMNAMLKKGWNTQITSRNFPTKVSLVRTENRYVKSVMGQSPELSQVFIYDVVVPDNNNDAFNYRAVIETNDCILQNLNFLGEQSN